MADHRRMERVNGVLREEIAALLASQVNDPRLRGLITITQVRTASDLRSARVYISVMGSAAIRKETLAGIQSSASYLRRELRGRVSLRHVPFLTFQLDDAMMDADRLMKIIEDLEVPNETGDDAQAPAERA
ncbi:Ribosome-binding factor A [Geodia barretti]|uniref:Ribosome-binding factor A n=1 Tax=Geodia barretti TaxID=519541 RepID=A0AA35RYC6_GEOBA|nr:Ribosome-binding factor A [Geodia barretti]